jgi:hypothetical protein
LIIQAALERPVEIRQKPIIRRIDPATLPSMALKPVTRPTKRIINEE